MVVIRRAAGRLALVVGLLAGAVAFAYYGEPLYRGTWCTPTATAEHAGPC